MDARFAATHEDWQNHRSRISLVHHQWSAMVTGTPRPVPEIEKIGRCIPSLSWRFILVMLQIWVFKIKLVEVRSRRGEARFRSSDTGIAPGTVFVPIHWGALGQTMQKPTPSPILNLTQTRCNLN